jgi:hypothetical protein
VHATKKLLDRIKAPVEGPCDVPSTNLGNWYAKLLTVGLILLNGFIVKRSRRKQPEFEFTTSFLLWVFVFLPFSIIAAYIAWRNHVSLILITGCWIYLLGLSVSDVGSTASKTRKGEERARKSDESGESQPKQ